MLRYIFFIFVLTLPLNLIGSPRVPSNYEFAGIKLSISDGARREIQSDVDALHRNQKYLQKKIDRINLYFPIIERVFSEEDLPDDFKYLVIQESALISDAVSTSNAVGFWQFKEASAREVGLRVDRIVDERMHITASSHAAAKYLKKNNFFFNNWVYALLAYNTGPGGAEQHINKKYLGKTKMDISKRTHWYVKKFLAHKIAFEDEIGKDRNEIIKLYEYPNARNKSLKEISEYFDIEQQRIIEYNKWLKRGRVPADKTYYAIIPVSSNDLVAQNLLGTGPATVQVVRESPKSKLFFQNEYKPAAEFDFSKNEEFPQVKNTSPTKIKINGLPGFIAKDTDNINSVTVGYGISEKKFRKINDMTASDQIIAGQVYYLKTKKSKAKIHYHVVIPGENAWEISQKYGIKLKKLLAKNRMREEKDLDPGMVMWLRFIRPGDVAVEYRESKAHNVVVQGISNQIEYPEKEVTSVAESEDIQEITTKLKATQEIDEEEFLFEEVDKETEYINENSYVDITKNPDDVTEEVAKIDDSADDLKKVKKSEIYHIVKQGETLFSISRQYGVSIGEIRVWNSIDNLDILATGQRLIIKEPFNTTVTPANESTNKEYIYTYRVKADDTLYGIARKHNISIKELMEINDKDDFVINVGEELKIKSPN